MDVDLELRFPDASRNSSNELQESLIAANFLLSASPKPNIGLIARQCEGPQVNVGLDEAVRSFLSRIGSNAGIVAASGGYLRIGVFYNQSESVVFPFRLSREVVQVICDLGLAIDATGYPCSDDDDDE